MPVTTPAIKVEAVRRLGGQVVLSGESFSDAWQHTLDLIQETGCVYIPPFDDPDVIAGQGTIAMEILRQHTGPIHAVFVPIGGGGMAAGIAAYIKNLRPDIRVIGVEPWILTPCGVRSWPAREWSCPKWGCLPTAWP